jgi:predicted nucleotidyltransferase
MRARGPGESARLLLDVVDVLTAHSIDYAVIGALAASLHGAGRASLDADLVVSASVMQGAGIENALKESGLATEFRRGDPEDAIPGLVRVSDSFGNQVDVLLGIRGLDPKIFARTVEVPLEGARLRFVGREDFIAMKAAAGGPIDLVDAENAIAANPGSLDVVLVRSLAARFGKSASASLDKMLEAAGLKIS